MQRYKTFISFIYYLTLFSALINKIFYICNNEINKNSIIPLNSKHYEKIRM